MRIRSVGWRSDVAMRALEGSEMLEQPGHLVIRTPSNPGFRWGNFILVEAGQLQSDPARWVDVFREAFPDAGHVAIGVDSLEPGDGVIPALAAQGLTRELNAVLTLTKLTAPAREIAAADFRRLESAEDWRQALDLRLVTEESSEGPAYRDFVERQMDGYRGVCERGHGAWFGAFRDGHMRSGLGVFATGGGIVAVESVDTHPEHRRLGLATGLILAAGEYAQKHLGARSLLIVADPGYFAIDIYRSLGFRDVERQLRFERIADA